VRKRETVSASEELSKVTKDLVVSMVYELKIEDEIIDSCEEDDPLQFIQGHGHIVPGLELAIEGMSIGESKHVSVKAEDGYGEFVADDIVELPRTEFPEDFPLELDMEVMVEDDDGLEVTAFVEEITLDMVTLNFNHPLAGRDLEFDVKITGLRHPTAEELEHDHIHMGDHDHLEE